MDGYLRNFPQKLREKCQKLRGVVWQESALKTVVHATLRTIEKIFEPCSIDQNVLPSKEYSTKHCTNGLVLMVPEDIRVNRLELLAKLRDSRVLVCTDYNLEVVL